MLASLPPAASPKSNTIVVEIQRLMICIPDLACPVRPALLPTLCHWDPPLHISVVCVCMYVRVYGGLEGKCSYHVCRASIHKSV